MQTLEKAKEQVTAVERTSAVSLPFLIVTNILALVISLFVAIIALEFCFSLGHIGEECFLQIEPLFGFGHIPEKLITWRAEGYSQTKYDSLGIRKMTLTGPGRQVTPAAEHRNVLLLGDSVLEAIQVPSDRSFSALIERKLNASAAKGTNYNLINYGVSAYGTLQEYLQYLKTVHEFKPETVVLFYHQGDNGDNFLLEGINNFLPRPYCKTDEQGNLVLDLDFYQKSINGEMTWSFHAFDYLRNNSRIYGTIVKTDLALANNQNYLYVKMKLSKLTNRISKWVTKRFVAIAEKGGAKVAQEIEPKLICSSKRLKAIRSVVLSAAEQNAKNKNDMVLNDERMVLTSGILIALAQDCEAKNCRLVVVGLPAPAENYSYVRELNAIRRLRDAKLANYAFIDLNSIFLKLTEDEKAAAYFVYGDHLKAKGHQMVADLLLKSIWNLEPKN